LGLGLDGDEGVGAAGGIRSVTDAAGDALLGARLVGPTDVGADSLPGTAPGPAPEEIVAALVAAGVRVRGFELERASLEQRFVELTGEGFDVVQ
jgi:ABC-2 type transport system ATP-binding protein